jgi:hypothetical protein
LNLKLTPAESAQSALTSFSEVDADKVSEVDADKVQLHCAPFKTLSSVFDVPAAAEQCYVSKANWNALRVVR